MSRLMIKGNQASGIYGNASQVKINEIEGLTAANAQEALVALNNSLSKLEKFQTSGQIDITSQMPYTFLSDGYVWLNADGTGNYAYVSIVSNAGVRLGILGASASAISHASIFVKKGTKVSLYSSGGSAKVYFTPLDR